MATFTYESIAYAFKNPTVSGNLTLSDDGADIYIGADNDLQITHSGSAGTIDCATGNLELQVDASAVISIKDEDGDNMATFTSNGASVLYHNNTATVSTVSGGTSLILTSSVGLATAMATGDMMSFTLIHATNTTGNYVDHINIDHIVITENWVGGSAPSAGGSSGVDIYTFNIIKKASGTGDTGFTVIGNQIKTS